MHSLAPHGRAPGLLARELLSFLSRAANARPAQRPTSSGPFPQGFPLRVLCSASEKPAESVCLSRGGGRSDLGRVRRNQKHQPG